MICENSSPASPSVSALLPSVHSLNPIKSNGVRLSSPLLSTASFQPASLKLPYPRNSKQSSSKTLRFIITSCIPACQSLIGKTAKPAFRFANCCRRDTSTPCPAGSYFLAQQFLVFQGVRFYENRLSSSKKDDAYTNTDARELLSKTAPRFSWSCWCWRESAVAGRVSRGETQLLQKAKRFKMHHGSCSSATAEL